ncbi:MAG: hypothetical protein ACFCUW_11515 [Kiloniellaceae bacterium]
MPLSDFQWFEFYPRCRQQRRGADIQSVGTGRPTNALICAALAEMVPSTAAEIAEATGLDPVTAGACLERLAATCRVMFNPLTKRYSLPRPRPMVGLAA